jgi:hypothetical protein
MVCCVFQATSLVNNYIQRKYARTFISRQEASNKLYMVFSIRFLFFYGTMSNFVIPFCRISWSLFLFRFQSLCVYQHLNQVYKQVLLLILCNEVYFRKSF